VPAFSQAQTCQLLAMADELKLTEEQVQRIQDNAFALKKDLIQVKANLQKAQLELKEIMLAKEIDKKAALKKTDEISAFKAELAKKKLSARIERLNMLNAEQKAKVRKMKMMKEHRGKGESWGMGMGPGMESGMRMRHPRGMGPMKDVEIFIEKEIISGDE
jgi:Spy/CpxP family protein refolding chaperone